MQISKLAKNVLKYLPVLAVLVATGISLFIGQALYPASLDSQPKTPMEILGARGTCVSPLIYTSLPPKCKTSDGSFIQANGISPYVIRIPEVK